jgi:hypothetical protein
MRRKPGYLSRCSDGLRAGRPGLDSRQRQEVFLFSTASRPTLGPTQPPVQWVLEDSPRGKLKGREADHSPPSSTEVKKGGAISLLPQISTQTSSVQSRREFQSEINRMDQVDLISLHIVTGLVKALRGNGSVNMFQQATIGTGFSVTSC